MKRLNVPSGSAQKLETVFTTLQTYMKDNFSTRRFLKLFETTGVYDAVDTNNLKAALGDQTYFTIGAGYGYFPDGEYIELATPVSKNFSSFTVAANKTYLIKLVHAETGSDPINVQTGFLYDTAGGTGTQRYSKYDDTYTVELTETTTPTTDVPDTDEIFLAYFTTDGSIVKSSFTDLRSANLAYLDIAFMNPAKVLLKDRDSVQDERLVGSLEVSESIVVPEVIISGNSGQQVSIKQITNGENGETETGFVIEPKTGTGALLVRDSNGDSFVKVDFANKRVSFGDSDQETKTVNIGGDVYLTGNIYKADGSTAVFASATPTDPSHFRIYDVYPTTNKDEKFGYVVLKWGLGPLTGTRSGATVLLTAGASGGAQISTADGEELTLDSDDANIIITKQLYSSRTNTLYTISGYNYSTRVLTISGSFTGSDASNNFDSTYPAYVVDKDCTGYVLKSLSTPNVPTYNGKPVVEIDRLDDSSYVTSPVLVKKLELDRKYSFYLKALNEETSTSYMQMEPGSYNPDHLVGGQAVESYTFPYVHTLPNIENTLISGSESVSLATTTNGFSIRIGGWDNSDEQQKPHEFKYQYFPVDDATSIVDGFISEDTRYQQISLTTPQRCTVKVWPVQNKQLVAASAVTQTISAGGNGITATDEKLWESSFNLTTLSGIVTSSEVYLNGFVDGSDLDDIAVSFLGSGIGSTSYMIKQKAGIESLPGREINFGGAYSAYSMYIQDTGIVSNTVHLYGVLPTAIPDSTTFTIGYSESSRSIGGRTFDTPYTITRVEVLLTRAIGVTNAKPAVIRLYPEGEPESASTIEVYQTGITTYSENINLKITPTSSAVGVLKVDAFDPDPTTPNNANAISGIIKIFGKPTVTTTTSRN